MIFDQMNLLSRGQAITDDAPSSDAIDLRSGNPVFRGDIGSAYGMNGIPLLIQVVENFSLLTSLRISVQVSEDKSFTTFKTLAEDVIPLARLRAGFTSIIRHAPPGANFSILRLFYSPIGAKPNFGRITAGLGVKTDVPL